MKHIVAVVLLITSFALAQTKPSTVPAKVTYLRCGTLYDGKSDTAQKNVTLRVVGEKIEKIGVGMTPEAGANVIDLSQEVCLPGLIDTHTHVLLQGDITAEDYDVQLLKSVHALPHDSWEPSRRERALEYGFTTIRDLETEGAGYADVDIKKAINNGVIPGPRMQVAGRAMDVTGAYPLLGYSWELKMPKGVQEVDGPEDGRKAVREQISHGVDWIKVYSDRSYYVRPDGVLDDVPTFTLDELKAIVDETHRERRKVASHAAALNGVHNSVEAGVDTIEHGHVHRRRRPEDHGCARHLLRAHALCRRICGGRPRGQRARRSGCDMIKIHEDTFRRALKAGVKIAFGTDAGGFDWKINPAKEFPHHGESTA